uniref:helix-turn-helix domain-containing protein n=1 Tax=Brachybacterium subflavum TaxID=2585206 RepID=UPI0022271922|nr:helix-turn-helix domain-containing protein [Brachybacterium subflavum]
MHLLGDAPFHGPPYAPLTTVRRHRAVTQVIERGRPIAHVASEFRIARATLSKWVPRYRANGAPALEDHSSALGQVRGEKRLHVRVDHAQRGVTGCVRSYSL